MQAVIELVWGPHEKVPSKETRVISVSKMRMSRILAAMKVVHFSTFLILTAVVGCGSSGSGSLPSSDGGAGSGLQGVIGGDHFIARDSVVAETSNWKSSFYPGVSTVILVSDWPDLCNGIEAKLTPKDTHLVIVDITNVSAGKAGVVSSTGDYTIVTDVGDLSHPAEFVAFYTRVNSSCVFADGSAISGSLNLSDANPTSPKGTLDVTFDDGSQIAGTLSDLHSCLATAVDDYLNSTPKCGG